MQQPPIYRDSIEGMIKTLHSLSPKNEGRPSLRDVLIQLTVELIYTFAVDCETKRYSLYA